MRHATPAATQSRPCRTRFYARTHSLSHLPNGHSSPAPRQARRRQGSPRSGVAPCCHTSPDALCAYCPYLALEVIAYLRVLLRHIVLALDVFSQVIESG